MKLVFLLFTYSFALLSTNKHQTALGSDKDDGQVLIVVDKKLFNDIEKFLEVGIEQISGPKEKDPDEFIEESEFQEDPLILPNSPDNGLPEASDANSFLLTALETAAVLLEEIMYDPLVVEDLLFEIASIMMNDDNCEDEDIVIESENSLNEGERQEFDPTAINPMNIIEDSIIPELPISINPIPGLGNALDSKDIEGINPGSVIRVDIIKDSLTTGLPIAGGIIPFIVDEGAPENKEGEIANPGTVIPIDIINDSFNNGLLVPNGNSPIIDNQVFPGNKGSEILNPEPANPIDVIKDSLHRLRDDNKIVIRINERLLEDITNFINVWINEILSTKNLRDSEVKEEPDNIEKPLNISDYPDYDMPKTSEANKILITVIEAAALLGDQIIHNPMILDKFAFEILSLILRDDENDHESLTVTHGTSINEPESEGFHIKEPMPNINIEDSQDSGSITVPVINNLPMNENPLNTKETEIFRPINIIRNPITSGPLDPLESFDEGEVLAILDENLFNEIKNLIKVGIETLIDPKDLICNDPETEKEPLNPSNSPDNGLPEASDIESFLIIALEAATILGDEIIEDPLILEDLVFEVVSIILNDDNCEDDEVLYEGEETLSESEEILPEEEEELPVGVGDVLGGGLNPAGIIAGGIVKDSFKAGKVFGNSLGIDTESQFDDSEELLGMVQDEIKTQEKNIEPGEGTSQSFIQLEQTPEYLQSQAPNQNIEKTFLSLEK